MQLAYSQPSFNSFSSYHGRVIFTRIETLPNLFHKLRIYRNLTRKSLAQKFGVPEDYIAKMETGQRLPSLKYCLLCAKEFGANPEWVKRKWFKEMMKGLEERLKKKFEIEN